MEKLNNNVRHVIVIGGGLVGSLCACFMAKRGYRVDLYEYREDIRKIKLAKGRSINLALSHRGRKALRQIGIEDLILERVVPMKGRLIHKITGETQSIPYDSRTNQCICSVGRNFLNQTLLTEIGKYPNVKIHFQHKLVNASLEEGYVNIMNLSTKETSKVTADLIIGADGAFSALRRVMQQEPLFDFSQTYIEHGYIELSIPHERGNEMIPNHLHIWPRGDFMMIALPNYDSSWTVTLFMPFKRFELLVDSEAVLRFFEDTFPDAVPLIGKTELVDTFLTSKPSSLVSIKCDPYHSNGKFLLIGDAAHAMVPFYGQGMNAGFEDCLLLNEILDKNDDMIDKTIEEFTRRRKTDAHAICDLALYNYVEMRDLVTKPSYQLRKMFDDFLFKIMPGIWVPLYNSVTFSSMGYAKCVDNRKWQNKVLHNALWTLFIIIFLAAYFIYICLQ